MGKYNIKKSIYGNAKHNFIKIQTDRTFFSSLGTQIQKNDLKTIFIQYNGRMFKEFFYNKP